MNKQTTIIAAVIVVIVIVLFSWNKLSAPDTKNQTASTGQTQQQTKESAQTEEPSTSSVISSIKDAIGLGKAMRCTYVDPTQNDIQSSVLIDGKRFVAESTFNGIKSHVVSDGETQYVWNDQDKKGFKMTQSCIAELNEATKNFQQNTPLPTPEDISKDFDTATDVQCVPADGADFQVPTDIEFADQCEMMRKSLDMMKQYQNQMPQTVPGNLQ